MPKSSRTYIVTGLYVTTDNGRRPFQIRLTARGFDGAFRGAHAQLVTRPDYRGPLSWDCEVTPTMTGGGQ